MWVFYFPIFLLFSAFYNEIFVPLTSIKILHSDNALEYTQSVINSFYADHGIIHQNSCTHTFQQNGVTKWKYCHLLDVAHTLLFNMHVLKHFWSDVHLVIQYACTKNFLSDVLLITCPLIVCVPLYRILDLNFLFSIMIVLLFRLLLMCLVVPCSYPWSWSR